MTSLDPVIARFCTEALEAWPDIGWPATKLADYVVEKISDIDDLKSAVARLSASELYLAAACVEGHPAALREFERHYLAQTRPALLRLGLSDAQVADVHQMVRS